MNNNNNNYMTSCMLIAIVDGYLSFTFLILLTFLLILCCYRKRCIIYNDDNFLGDELQCGLCKKFIYFTPCPYLGTILEKSFIIR